MTFPVLKGTAYTLVHTPDILVHEGKLQESEMRNNPDSDYLKAIPDHLRSFEDAVGYGPNQAYIGNIHPRDLKNIEKPWYEHPLKDATTNGKFGSIMSEDMFYGCLKAVDMFDLVVLEASYQEEIAKKLNDDPVIGKYWVTLDKLTENPSTVDEIKSLIEDKDAKPLYLDGKLVGCIKRAHEFDAALTSDVMFENLVSKASAAYVLAELFAKNDIKPNDVDYLIECSEEGCGDMFQRAGGNYAKSIGEICGCVNATGSDTRSFCAAPSHSMVEASALVQAGVYSNIVVLAGGSSAKLGMNGKDHVKKDQPLLEDCLGAFAIHVGENDGKSPVIRTDIVGKHKIGSGAAPQAIMQAIVADPLEHAGLSIKDVDVFSAEMQNPEITVPAGAGDIPSANYKMIAALGIMKKVFARDELNQVVENIGMPGFVPTQGHIPSGVPFLGHAKEMIENGDIHRTMIIGKGSLFLGRLTNLFDGISFIVETNDGHVGDDSVDKDTIRQMIAESMKKFADSLK
ncbi:glycine reductase complex component C subunit beta [Companilactobacillus tucceti DSM 20183]|uniref:Glycine reductase complex component C subunit beta n=1 Tax=Companilactobacillus tucceti DSM 20183 TaxID=1423811 RepID=A0A0R1J2U2_9LACO|nr:glycine/sarcosine/betaine reductase complex component C subunit beta [Companilactobacillus tucceti]KRK65355.1 glycine reductase complex component C subunit beta [Companilactobacillus tucceti DSM 20183]